MPGRHPNITKLIEQNLHNVLLKEIFYLGDNTLRPDESLRFNNIEITKVTTRSVDANITLTGDRGDIIWSSPYSKNWILYLNGNASPLKATSDGLTTFKVNKQFNKVRLYYRPWYFTLSILLSVFFILALLLLSFPLRRRHLFSSPADQPPSSGPV